MARDSRRPAQQPTRDPSCTAAEGEGSWGASRTLVLILGTLGGVAGALHGLSEIQKGNVSTEGHLLSSVGAFTLVTNYLATGVAAVILGTAGVVWTVGFVHLRHGPLVFLGLFLALFCVGGGIAQAPFILLGWGVATRINKPVTWFDRPPLASWRTALSTTWLPLLVSSLAPLVAGMGIWMILLPPGVEHGASAAQYLCWSLVAISALLLPCAALAGLARDATAGVGNEASAGRPEESMLIESGRDGGSR